MISAHPKGMCIFYTLRIKRKCMYLRVLLLGRDFMLCKSEHRTMHSRRDYGVLIMRSIYDT